MSWLRTLMEFCSIFPIWRVKSPRFGCVVVSEAETWFLIELLVDCTNTFPIMYAR